MSVGFESSPSGTAQGSLQARRASPLPQSPTPIWKRNNQSSEVTDGGDGSGLEARSPVTEHLCPPKHAWGGGPGPPPPTTQESCMGLPAPKFTHLKTISQVAILGSCVTQAHPCLRTHHPLSWEKETVTDSVDRAPGRFGNSREVPGPARGPEDFLEAVVPQLGLIGRRGAMRCMEWVFGAAGTVGNGPEPPEYRPACGALAPPLSPSRCQRGRALVSGAPWRRLARGSDRDRAGWWRCWEWARPPRLTYPGSIRIRRKRTSFWRRKIF